MDEKLMYTDMEDFNRRLNTPTLYKEVTTCRLCGSRALEPILNLGNLCISDFPAPGAVDEDRAPLSLALCHNCTLIQLRHTVNRDRLYRNYYYHSGTNETMISALRDVVGDALARVDLQPEDYVVDIGANDGTLLEQYQPKFPITRVGFEPSNLCVEKQTADWIMFHDYFPPRWHPNDLMSHKAKIITSIACFYDVDNPSTFVSSIKDWLHDDGIWICQFQDFGSMLTARAFDNICHEHLIYWSDATFNSLLNQHGLCVVDRSHNDINGGSIRYIVKHGSKPHTAYLLPRFDIRKISKDMKLFANDIRDNKAQVMRLLDNLHTAGSLVFGYGASTKGNTLLQYYGIDPDLIPYIADRNPDKVGLTTAGTHIPIISEETMREMRPAYLLTLPWHFIHSFIKREVSFLAHGGHFIVPVPMLQLVSASPKSQALSVSSTPGGPPCPSTPGASFAKV